MIAVTIWDGSEFVANVTHQITSGRVATDEQQGFDYLDLTLDMSFGDVLRWYYDRTVYKVRCTTQHGALLFEGRLEDVATTDNGLRMLARGGKSKLSDDLYTAFWSSDRYDDWRILNQEDNSTYKADKYEQDNNQRLYIALRDGETYQQNEYGIWQLTTPNQSETFFKRVHYTVAVNLPANWNAYLTAHDGATSEVIWQLSTGAGTYTTNISASDRNNLALYIWYDTTGSYANTSETGTYYVKLTSVRAFGNQTTGSVDSDDVIKDVIASSSLDSDTTLVESPGVDHDWLVLEDESQLRVVDALANYGDGSTQWVAQVWNDDVLVFAERGHNSRTFAVDVAAIDIQRQLREMHNSTYSVYRDDIAGRVRTADNTDAASIDRYGVTRRTSVNADTTSSSTAETVRDQALTASAIPEPNTSIVFGKLFNEVGAGVPAHAVRGGDILKIRNLPPMNDEIDELRTGRVYRTEFDLVTGVNRVVVGSEIVTTKSLLEKVF